METNSPQIILIIVTSYLLGSIPTAYLIARYFHRKNIFDYGSGNMGGTNVARTMGLHWGIITAAVDILKGMVAVAIAQTILPDERLSAAVLAALTAVTGHNWSIFASILYSYYHKKFSIRGGKGAATAFGTMVMMLPPEPLILMLVIGIMLAVLTRYASLAVLVSFAIALSWAFFWSISAHLTPIYAPYVFALAVLIVWRFRENIQRLIEGTERKLGERVA